MSYPVKPSQRDEFEAAVADLTIASADYETAYRARHGRDAGLVTQKASALNDAAAAAQHAYDRLVDVTDSVILAQQIRAALIFATSRVQGERRPSQYSMPSSVLPAIKRAWEYSV